MYIFKVIYDSSSLHDSYHLGRETASSVDTNIVVHRRHLQDKLSLLQLTCIDVVTNLRAETDGIDHDWLQEAVIGSEDMAK